MRVLSLLAVLGLFSACSDPCLDLAKKVCDCDADTSAARVCKAQAEAQAANIDTTDGQDSRCEELLDQCRCDLLETLEGRQRCGLANTAQ